jgi:hypothetical protein
MIDLRVAVDGAAAIWRFQVMLLSPPQNSPLADPPVAIGTKGLQGRSIREMPTERQNEAADLSVSR